MLPRASARVEEQTATMVEFQKRFRNSSRTVDSARMVSGERPIERSPSHFGVKSTQGIMLACMTSGAALKVVVIVQ